MDGPRKRPRVDDRSSPLYPYLHGARGCVRDVPYMLFGDLESVFMQGIHEAGLKLADDVEEDAEARAAALNDELARTRLEKQRSIAFNVLAEKIPSLRDLLAELVAYPELYTALVTMMQDVQNDGKCDDTAIIKREIIKYARKDPKKKRIMDDTDIENKSKRGLNVRNFAYGICTRKHYDAMVEDYEGTKERFEQGAIKIDNTSLPVMLYDEDLWDDSSDEAGLLRNFVMVRMWRRVNFGKAENVLNTPKTVPAGSNADTHKIMQVSPASIAYIACQVRFAMSSAATWSRMDGYYDLKKLYDEIMMFLELDEEDPDEWVVETLRWWNCRAFGNPEGREADDTEAGPELSAEADSVMAARAARKLARASGRSESVEI